MSTETEKWKADADRLRALGESIYGDRWQARLAQCLEMSPSKLSLVLKGERTMTDDDWKRVVEMLERTIPGDQESFNRRQDLMQRTLFELRRRMNLI